MSTDKKKPAGKPRIRQRSVSSAATPILVDSRPRLEELPLPGIRRAAEGRGGATDDLVVMRTIIRSPLLPFWAAVIPKRTMGRKPSVPDLFWLFYLVFWRELVSAEKLDQFLRANWTHVREEFWFEHKVLLPDAKPNGDVPGYHDFKQWRKNNILGKEPDDAPLPPSHLITRLVDALSDAALPLAKAIRRSEAGDDYTPDPMSVTQLDCVAADGSVMNAPSDVRAIEKLDPVTGELRTVITNSRAKTSAAARVHHAMTNTSQKPHGATEGLFNTVAVFKGYDTYTRVVLGVEITLPFEGEKHAADRLLTRLYDKAGDTFPVLLYDGTLTPIIWQEYTARYGVWTVNANYARSTGDKIPDDFDPKAPIKQVGFSTHAYGRKKGEPKKTWVTDLGPVSHTVDGQDCVHHLAADDGAVYELNTPIIAGGHPNKIGLLAPTARERHRDGEGRYYFRVTLTGQCTKGGSFDYSIDLTYTKPDRRGHVPWKSLVANIRLLPDARVEEFSRVYGWRNQIESFFSWMERCFYNKDRHASWGRKAQLLDLAATGMLANVEAWAHLARRHPHIAADFAAQLAAQLAAATEPAAGDIAEEGVA